MGRLPIFAISLLLMAFLTSGAMGGETRPKFPPDETVSVRSLTLTDEQFLRGDTTNAIPVMLTGELRFPNWQQRLPAVVLLHGSGGPGGATAQWAAFLDKLGIATFQLDSFGGRGIDHVSMDQSQLPIFAQIYDTYRAVELLAAHPRIDGSRIAVMGFSRGGIAALYTSMQRFQKSYGPTGTRIAAYLPFYPSCGIQLVGELDISDAPIREFHGALDDWTPAAPCRDYIARLKAVGKDALMTEYPEARHSFDDPSSPPGYVIQSAQTTRNCQRREVAGEIMNVQTGKRFSYDDPCVELGPTVGYDKVATEAAQVSVKEFLTEVFRLRR